MKILPIIEEPVSVNKLNDKIYEIDGKMYHLTRRSGAMFDLLCERSPGRVFPADLMDALNEKGFHVSTAESARVDIPRLRRSIQGSPLIVINEHGVGYRLAIRRNK